MGLKQDAEIVLDRASRIVRIIARSQVLLAQGKFLVDNQQDMAITIDQVTRDAWQARIAALKAEIKTITSAW